MDLEKPPLAYHVQAHPISVAMVCSNKMRGTFVRQPLLADVPYAVQMEPNLVIEFYSR